MLWISDVLTNSSDSTTIVCFKPYILAESAIFNKSSSAHIALKLSSLGISKIYRISTKVGLILLKSTVNYNQIRLVARFFENGRINIQGTSEGTCVSPKPVVSEIHQISIS